MAGPNDDFFDDDDDLPSIDQDAQPDDDQGGDDKAPVDPDFDDLPRHLEPDEDQVDLDAADDGAEEGREDDENLSDEEFAKKFGGRRVQKRIGNLTRRLREAEERAALADQRAAERDRFILGKAKKEAEDKIANGTKRIETLEAELEAAIEAGDTKKQVALNRELRAADLDLRDAKGLKDKADRAEIEITRGGQGNAAPGNQPNPQRDAWLNANPWFRAEGNDALKQFITNTDRALHASGSDIQSPDHFRKINAAARAAGFTQVRDSDGGGRRQPTRHQGRTNMGGPMGNSQDGGLKTRDRGGNRVTLTAADRAHMEQFGLDPDNKDHVAAFAAERRASARKYGTR